VRPLANRPSFLSQAVGLLLALSLTFGAATVGGIASINAGAFYGQLVRPSWAPPGWLFGPVWSVLYTLMALAVWLAWRGSGFSKARVAILLFVAQLVANALWSWLFFRWRLGALALADVLVLWVLVAATMAAFWRIHRPAAVLLAPYLAWITFAAALTFAVWRANPQLLQLREQTPTDVSGRAGHKHKATGSRPPVAVGDPRGLDQDLAQRRWMPRHCRTWYTAARPTRP
jgi:tryptophan-rich sensory protein